MKKPLAFDGQTIQFYLLEIGNQYLEFFYYNCLENVFGHIKNMKPSLRWIPLEVWVDVFCCIFMSRWKLGRIVDRIGNRKFAEYLQFYLHDWGKHSLDNLYFDQQGMFKYLRHADRFPLDPSELVGSPMPERIISFGSIRISHFNWQTILFLHQIRPLLRQANLKMHTGRHDLANLHSILPRLLPLLEEGGLHSLDMDSLAVPLVAQHFAQPLATQMAMLVLHNPFANPFQEHDQAVDFVLDWLTGAGGATRPRLYKAWVSWDVCQRMCAQIRQHFLDAKSPCTFAVKFLLRDFEVPDHFLQNSIGEELHGQMHVGEGGSPAGAKQFHIYRHAANAGSALREWVEKTLGKSEKRCITLHFTSIGKMDPIPVGNAAHGGGEQNNEEEDDQPSTSKKFKA